MSIETLRAEMLCLQSFSLQSAAADLRSDAKAAVARAIHTRASSPRKKKLAAPVALNKHPSLHGNSSWPPAWIRTRGDKVNTLRGLVGVLTYVHANPAISGRCYLVNNYKGESYVGSLTFDDLAVCKKFIDLLKANLNRQIKDIGELEFPVQLQERKLRAERMR